MRMVCHLVRRAGTFAIAFAFAFAFCALPAAAQLQPAADAASTPPRWTFGWPLDGARPAPRGGTSQGVPVAIDPSPAPAWLALQQPGLDARERDRRAILAMAGSWRVTFDFVEVASFGAAPDAAAPAPYQSWGTEKVYVDRDEPGRVSLVHILEMRVAGMPEPIVTKHWRQDWTFEPTAIVEYRGRDRWQRRSVAAAERRGAWLQTVLQVDESPRYASIGRWQHTPGFSSWIGGDTWRPLPRREWTVRSDYQALVGTNRHAIVAGGWLQEENNLKAVLGPDRALDPQRPYVGREYGVARYERLREPQFAEADRYYAATRGFWRRVEAVWDDAFARRGSVTLRGASDRQSWFVPLFERAGQIADGTLAEGAGDDAAIRAALVPTGLFDGPQR